MAVSIQESIAYQISQRFLFVWLNSRTYQILASLYVTWVRILDGSLFNRLLAPYISVRSDSWGIGQLSIVRSFWNRVGGAIVASITNWLNGSRVQHSATILSQELREAPISSLGAVSFGFSTIYFALEFLFGSLSGSMWLFIAIAITLLGLLGIALPSTLFQGSVLGRRIPHRDTKHLPGLILVWCFHRNLRIFLEPFVCGIALVVGCVLGLGLYLGRKPDCMPSLLMPCWIS